MSFRGRKRWKTWVKRRKRRNSGIVNLAKLPSTPTSNTTSVLRRVYGQKMMTENKMVVFMGGWLIYLIFGFPGGEGCGMMRMMVMGRSILLLVVFIFISTTFSNFILIVFSIYKCSILNHILTLTWSCLMFFIFLGLYYLLHFYDIMI